LTTQRHSKIHAAFFSSLNEEKVLMFFPPDGFSHMVVSSTEESWGNANKLLCVLGDGIMEPVVSILESAGYDSAVIIPSGVFSNLPFHAAMQAEEPLTYAIDRVAIAYAPSARLLAFARKVVEELREEDKEPFLLTVSNPQPTAQVHPQFAKFETTTIAVRFYSYLEGTKYGGPRCVSGEHANRSFVYDLLKMHPLAHFACHGFFDPENPLGSGIWLAKDERLTVSDLLSLQMTKRMAVLSCCETGIVIQTPQMNQSDSRLPYCRQDLRVLLLRFGLSTMSAQLC
jgi:CHAT domain-containing protein